MFYYDAKRILLRLRKEHEKLNGCLYLVGMPDIPFPKRFKEYCSVFAEYRTEIELGQKLKTHEARDSQNKPIPRPQGHNPRRSENMYDTPVRTPTSSAGMQPIPRDPSQIQRALDQLKSTISTTEEIYRQIQCRLEPCLRPPEPKPGTEKPKTPDCHVPLAACIHESIDRLQQLSSAMDDMLSRIEI